MLWLKNSSKIKAGRYLGILGNMLLPQTGLFSYSDQVYVHSVHSAVLHSLYVQIWMFLSNVACQLLVNQF